MTAPDTAAALARARKWVDLCMMYGSEEGETAHYRSTDLAALVAHIDALAGLLRELEPAWPSADDECGCDECTFRTRARSALTKIGCTV